MRQSVPAVWRGGGKAVVAACVAALIAVFPMTASAATASWTIVPSPGYGGLVDVTCVGASDCWAVGYAGDMTIEHNTGSGWVIVASPKPTDSGGGAVLNGVTCVSVSDCWTVGYYENTSIQLKNFFEHWDGTSWVVVSSPDTPIGNFLTSIKCVNASNCWAVGGAVIEQYNGTSWVVVATDAPELVDVACLRRLGDCWAVGAGFGPGCATPGKLCTSIEHNKGNGWVFVPSPSVPNVRAYGLQSVTCESVSNCWAVGYVENRKATKYFTLTEHYDGSRWTIIPSPNVRSSSLSGVSCASWTDCWAVGGDSSNGGHTLIEHNTGNGWVIVMSPNSSTQDHLVLRAVKCVSTRDCWAVGNYYNNSTGARTLIEHYG